VYETWRDIESTLARNERLSTRQIALMRLALNHVTTVLAEVCTFAYKAGGGSALHGGALQRCFRDIYAGTQHRTTSPTVLRECGGELAGIAEGKEWAMIGLVDPLE